MKHWQTEITFLSALACLLCFAGCEKMECDSIESVDGQSFRAEFTYSPGASGAIGGFLGGVGSFLGGSFGIGGGSLAATIARAGQDGVFSDQERAEIAAAAQAALAQELGNNPGLVCKNCEDGHPCSAHVDGIEITITSVTIRRLPGGKIKITITGEITGGEIVCGPCPEYATSGTALSAASVCSSTLNVPGSGVNHGAVGGSSVNVSGD